MGAIGKMFGGGSTAPQIAPPPPPPPPPSTPPTYASNTPQGDAQGNMSAGARAAGASGFEGTVITGPEGLKAGAENTSKTKLGQ